MLPPTAFIPKLVLCVGITAHHHAYCTRSLTGFGGRGLTQALGGIFLIQELQYIFGHRPGEESGEPRLYMLVKKLEYIGAHNEFEKDDVNKLAALDPSMANFRIDCKRT